MEQWAPWLGALLGFVALLQAFGELRVWSRLGFRSPTYLGVALALATLLGLSMAALEWADEARPIPMVVALLACPMLVVLGFLLHGGPSEFVRTRPLDRYPAGVVAGEVLRLRSALQIMDDEGRPTGRETEAGSRWAVVPGTLLDPSIVWLEDPEGEVVPWDGELLFDWFERSEDAPTPG